MKRALLGLALAAAVLAPAAAVDSIAIAEPLIASDTPENRTFVESLLARAAVLATRRYADDFTVTYSGSPAGAAAGGAAAGGAAADYTIEVTASLSDGAAGVFKIVHGDGEQTASYLDIFSEQNVGYIAGVFASLWSSLSDGFTARRSAPPDLMDILPVNVVLAAVPGLMPAQASSLVALSAAVKSTGDLLLAFGSTVVELDPRMRVTGVLGRDLMDEGSYTFAGGVHLTPADTVYLKPSMGRQARRLVDGGTELQPINLGMDPYGSLTVLHDGSIVAFDTTAQKVFRITTSSREEINLKTSPSSYIWHLDTGPDGNIWSWDLTERRIKIHTKDAVLIDAILPITNAGEYLSPTALEVYPDGSFVIFVQGAGGFELRRYGRDGVLIWRMNELAAPQPETLPSNVSLAFDGDRGYLYIVDTLGRRVIRLFDSAWAAKHGISTSGSNSVIALNRKLQRNPGSANLRREKAELYTSRGATQLAIAAWKDLLAADPSVADARQKLDRLEVDVLLQQAGSERRSTLALLEQFGPASAQMQYMNTLRVYEQILHRTPGNDKAGGEMEDLMRAFQQRSAGPPGRSRPAEIERINIGNLFPSLMLVYRDKPVGSVVIANTTGSTIQDVTARLFIKKYMDFPAESAAVQKVGPDAQAELPLYALLNEDVLSLQEDLPIQAQIQVVYSADGERQSIEQVRTVTLYRNTALSWDDSGKLASFIMPNEGIVSAFAHRVLSGNAADYAGLPAKMVRAAKLCDALGTYGIEYIEDPDAPFSEILGRAQVIDTVRFPRMTLHIRSGDCDDTTALLGSLLESSGVRTAIMTSPGHVFLAVDTEEPEENRWLFDAEGFVTVPHRGTIWIPIETTALGHGFFESWRIASGLVLDHPDEIEFLPVAAQRNLYPALPLPESSMTVVEPRPNEVDALLSASMAETIDLLYNAGITSLQTALGSARGRRELKIRNKLGVLHARFGNAEQAEAAFQQNLRTDPDYTASYLNLANLLVSERRNAEALETLRSGLERRPDSATLNLLAARLLHADARYDDARQHLEAVRRGSPELAERYAGLAEVPNTTGRAGINWAETPMIWEEGPE